MTRRKDPSAVALGRRGGAANTDAQSESRRRTAAAMRPGTGDWYVTVDAVTGSPSCVTPYRWGRRPYRHDGYGCHGPHATARAARQWAIDERCRLRELSETASIIAAEASDRG